MSEERFRLSADQVLLPVEDGEIPEHVQAFADLIVKMNEDQLLYLSSILASIWNDDGGMLAIFKQALGHQEVLPGEQESLRAAGHDLLRMLTARILTNVLDAHMTPEEVAAVVEAAVPITERTRSILWTPAD